MIGPVVKIALAVICLGFVLYAGIRWTLEDLKKAREIEREQLRKEAGRHDSCP